MKYQEAVSEAQKDATRSGITMAVIGDLRGRRNLFNIVTLQSAKLNGWHVWKVVEPAEAKGKHA